MNSHSYRFTVEHVEDNKGNPVKAAPLNFTAQTHDDLFKIVEKVKTRMDLDETDATGFAVGLKLFGEVMMKNRDQELFKQFTPHFASFMKELKQS